MSYLRHGVAGLCLVLLSATIRAEEHADLPRDAVAASARVRAAFEAARLDELQAYARQRQPPDRWLITDRLCAEGAYDAASAYAKAVEGGMGKRLQDYVVREQKGPTPPAAREALAAGLVHGAAGRLDEALKTVADASYEIGVTGSRLLFLRGDALGAAGRPAEAGDAFSRAAAAARATGWLGRAAYAYRQSGRKYGVAGQTIKVVEAREKVLEISREREIPLQVAMSLIDLGASQVSAGRLEEARRNLEEGAREAARLGARNPQGVAVTALARILSINGSYELAIEKHNEALRIYEEAKQPTRQSSTHNRLAQIYVQLNDTQRAHEHYARSRALAKEQKNLAAEAAAVINAGYLYLRTGNYAKSLVLLEDGLAIAERAGHRLFVRNALLNLASAHNALRNLEQARRYMPNAHRA